MARTYYTLAHRNEETGVWSAQFGDYSRATVFEEREEWFDHYDREGLILRRRDIKIITSGDQQTDIDAAIAKLNAA